MATALKQTGRRVISNALIRAANKPVSPEFTDRTYCGSKHNILKQTTLTGIIGIEMQASAFLSECSAFYDEKADGNDIAQLHQLR